ncbi:GNAT family N-acetyltransferase [Natronorubrum sp. A-ect3]|uniref:GNAT family N-acetyltransferase n=1 Tax=Natronorubrum sp. A-ect3 TaxID=3242698 RepID=UPI00359E157F
MRGEFRTGDIEQSQVLSLLNESFEDWGDEELFQWKYNEYPRYDPDKHSFSITIDGELAAFRRVFRKEFVTDEETIPIHIYGDTAVAPKYQGRGLYSKLYERTKEYSEQSDAKYVAAFNRKGNLTFDANLERGWSYQTLPLQLRIISPKPVLKTYASYITNNTPVIDSVLKTVGHRLHITTSDGILTVEEMVAKNNKSGYQSIGPVLSDIAIADYVEEVSTDGNTLKNILTRSFSLAINGHVSIDGTLDDTKPKYDGLTNIETRVKNKISGEEIDRIISISGEDEVFRRSARNLHHLIQYPKSDVILAYDNNNNIIGYAILGPQRTSDVVEGRILEIQTKNNNNRIRSALLNRALDRSINRGFDLLLVISEESLGRKWARVDYQTIVYNNMNDDYMNDDFISPSRFSFYDIV